MEITGIKKTTKGGRERALRNGQTLSDKGKPEVKPPEIAVAPGQIKPLRGSYAALRPCGGLHPSATAQGTSRPEGNLLAR